MRKDRHLRAKERGLARAQPCLHPRLLGSGTERNERVLWKPPTRPLERRGGGGGGGRGDSRGSPAPAAGRRARPPVRASLPVFEPKE